MKKLITALVVAAALAIPATPAFAIHHMALPFVVSCAHSENALGVPAFNNGLDPDALHSNEVLSDPNFPGAQAPRGERCAGNQ